MLRRFWAVCCLVLSLCALAHDSAAAATTSRTHVYLLRGIFNVSVGLDELAGKLNRLGLATSVYGHDDAAAVAAEAIGDYRAGKVRTVILIGHSLGAGGVLAVADALNAAHVPVALLITLESGTSGPVPANVRRAVNFYIAGSGVPVTAGAGFRGSVQNLDVGGIPGMGHMAIQSMPSMHNRMIGYVNGARGG